MYRITSKFSQQESFRSTPHSGIDFAMNLGEPIRSIKDGIVTVHDYGNFNAGKTVFIKWEDGKTAIYGHLNDFVVKDGQHVQAGDLLVHAGNTGHSFGNHLHFGLKENGHFIDPSPYINDIQQMNVKQFVQHIPEPTTVKMNFFDYMNAQMNAIGQLKMNLISSLTNDSLFIQISKQLLQFITSHTSTLNDIIACII
jgi:hypothetical protein